MKLIDRLNAATMLAFEVFASLFISALIGEVYGTSAEVVHLLAQLSIVPGLIGAVLLLASCFIPMKDSHR